MLNQYLTNRFWAVSHYDKSHGYYFFPNWQCENLVYVLFCRNNDMASSTSAAMGLPPDVSTDDMRAKMMSRFKDVKDRASQSRTNFSKIFGAKK